MAANATRVDTTYLARHDSFQGLMVEAYMNGIYTAIVLFTVHRIVSRRGFKAIREPLFQLMLLMFICATIHWGRRWNNGKEGFVDNAGSLSALLKALSNDTLAGTVVALLSRGTIMFVADSIMIWRCWKLFSQSWAVIALPVTLLLGEIASLIAYIVFRAKAKTSVVTKSTTRTLSTAHSGFTLATTVLVTILIVYRIIILGGLKKYKNIIAIIIESSALYAIATIIYMPFPLVEGKSNIIPNAVLTPMAGIASTLVIARVCVGEGIERTLDGDSDTALAARGQSGQVSALKFDHGTKDEEASTGIYTDTIGTTDQERQTRRTNDTYWKSGSLRGTQVDEEKENANK